MGRFYKNEKLFKASYYIEGNWTFESISNFSKCKVVSADTETHLTRNKIIQTEDEVYRFYKECTAEFSKFDLKYFRSNIYVEGYAFMLSDGINFALFQNIEDFLTCITYMEVDKVIWYNGKFDWALFDYYFFTNGWKNADDIIEKGKRGHLPAKTFQSLNGEFSQRYQMQIWNEYKNSSRHTHVKKITFIDLCNVLGGGLAKNLEAFDIEDHEGNKVRKLEMDYVAGNIYDLKDIQYMINDTKGLQLLAEKFDEVVKEASGYSFINGDFITAGGLAKKSLLKFMFKKSDKTNRKAFKYYLPMTLSEDKEYRSNYIYKGGLCIVNEDYKGKVLHNIHKYDINSMYPSQMRNKTFPFGRPKIYAPENLDSYKKGYIYLLKIKNLSGVLKTNMIPIYMDALSNKFLSFINCSEERYIYLDELELYEKYYDLSYDIVSILEFRACKSKGMIEFIDNYYKIKCTTNNKPLKQCSKLILNSAYGKLAQRAVEEIIKQYLTDDGYVQTLHVPVKKVDDSVLLSILWGARVSSNARIDLGNFILRICKNNPKKNFIYCDTDSVASFCTFDDTDPKELGKMKYEGFFSNAIYLAPKTYMLQDPTGKYEVHTKGVNTDVVLKRVEACKDFEDACNTTFKANVTFKCLSGLNCAGGKALFYIDKTILNDNEDDPEDLLPIFEYNEMN